MDFLDRIAAWTGAIVSLLTLVWRASTWRRSRHKIRVLVSNQFFAAPNGQAAHFVTTRVTNTGKDAIAVSGFGVKVGRSGSAANFRLQPGSASIPTWLGQNETAHFHLLAEELRVLARQERISLKSFRTCVYLSDGSTKSANRSVPLS